MMVVVLGHSLAVTMFTIMMLFLIMFSMPSVGAPSQCCTHQPTNTSGENHIRKIYRHNDSSSVIKESTGLENRLHTRLLLSLLAINFNQVFPQHIQKLFKTVTVISDS